MSMTDPFNLAVGETPVKAVEMLTDIGVSFSALRMWDEENSAGDCAYHPDRLNLVVKAGLVTEAYIG